MRASLLMTSSFALVATALVAIAGPALAQDVPVVYRTDPGEAHPRYAPAPPPVEQASPMHVSQQPMVQGMPAPEAVAAPSYSANSYQMPVSYTSNEVYGPGTVTVQPGDTVYGLARQYGVVPTDIIALNGLYTPYKLSIGQVIALPDAQRGVSPSPVAVAVAMNTPASPSPNSALPRSQIASPLPPAMASAERVYMVRQGDTLYHISRQFGVSVQSLARANNLYPPYPLSLNQALRVPDQAPAYNGSYGAPSATPAPQMVTRQKPLGVQPILVSKNPNSRFAWPLRGALLREYGVGADGQRYDGISIAAPVGAPIRAADDGEVVYTGTDLEGYGNLLLISHDGGWVSAYAHTDSNLVHKGDKVRQGQVVAKVGDSGGVAQSQLHFELRHDLQPRDPLKALTGQDMIARANFR